jgi:hypothetical protein
VYAEGESAAWFSIEPGEFALDAGEVRAVTLVVAPPVTTRVRQYEATICVVTLQPDTDLRLGAGIRVQAHINVAVLVLSAMSGTSWPTWAGAAAGIVIVGALARRRRPSRAES